MDNNNKRDHSYQEFIETLRDNFSLNDEIIQYVINSIKNSGCEKIQFENFNFGAMGLALHDRVLINRSLLSNKLEFILFVIFHEIAHQYQYRKYGSSKMYQCYTDEIITDEPIEFMKKAEIVADEFGSRKIRQLQSKGLISNNFTPPKYYKTMSLQQFRNFIERVKERLDMRNITSPEEISELFYNMIKNTI